MQRSEFAYELEKLGKKDDLTDQQYKEVEYVYTYYPAISETVGKRQIAELLATFGMTIIYDMTPRAEEAEKLELDLMAARHKVTVAEEALRNLKYAKSVDEVVCDEG